MRIGNFFLTDFWVFPLDSISPIFFWLPSSQNCSHGGLQGGFIPITGILQLQLLQKQRTLGHIIVPALQELIPDPGDSRASSILPPSLRPSRHVGPGQMGNPREGPPRQRWGKPRLPPLLLCPHGSCVPTAAVSPLLRGVPSAAPPHSCLVFPFSPSFLAPISL